MSRKVLPVVLLAAVLGLTAAKAGAVEWRRAAYWDGRYATQWVGSGEGMRDALAGAGYAILNADELKSWMEDRIGDGAMSVVVFCRDVVPDTITESRSADCTLRQYLDAGGKIVWYGELPFYYQGHADGTTTTWGNGGSTAILGFNAANQPYESNQQVVLTSAGTDWGLTQRWASTRATTIPDDPTGFTVLARAVFSSAGSNSRYAAAWARHYVEDDRFRGFVRIWDVYIGFGNTIIASPSVEEVMAVAEYVAFKASEPQPATGADGVSSGPLAWRAGEYAISHAVYFGTSPELGEADKVDETPSNATHWNTPAFEPDATYYWRIDEIDVDGIVHEGAVWSFTAAPSAAHAPVPQDGAEMVGAEQPALTWSPGLDAVLHEVYFGDDPNAVAEGDDDTYQGSQADTAFVAGSLERGKTYYWRVDEILSDGTTVVGPVWSFTTLQEIAPVDPSLVGWWKFDEEDGTVAIDSSGHDRHGTLTGSVARVDGLFGRALDFEHGNADDAVVVPAFDLPEGGISMTAWIRPESFSQHDARIIEKASGVASANDAWWMLGSNSSGSNYVLRFRLKTNDDRDSTTLLAASGHLSAGEWAHTAATWDGTNMFLYKDGEQVGQSGKGGTAVAANPDLDMTIGNSIVGGAGLRAWDGLIDDVRVYNKALTFNDLDQVMKGDPLPASNPNPANGAAPDSSGAVLLTWQPGERAFQHDVYLGTDRALVRKADASDATGIYRGRFNAPSYMPNPAVERGQQYFWRVDEINGDGTISAGHIWTFTVADYLIVDDFEGYTDNIDADETIFQTWLDGYFDGSSGSTVGYLDAPFAERGVVHGGRQSMPLHFDNSIAPYYSEAERSWFSPQDWTAYGGGSLQMQVRGRTLSGVTEYDPASETYAITGAGYNIWATSDQFHFAYKELTGDGSVTVRVDGMSEELPHGDPRVGVMIRDTFDNNAANAIVFAEPDPRTRLTARVTTGGDTSSVATIDGVGTTPIWLRLTREGFVFKAARSSDGVNWMPLLDSGSEVNISMMDPVYIGLVVCSHASGQFIEGRFSNVSTTGNVAPSGPFTVSRDVGIASNPPELVYVALEDSAGRMATVKHAELATTDAWQTWEIPLADFSGVNPAAIRKMVIGVGDRSNPMPGGVGTIYIDDVRVMDTEP